MEKLFLNIKNKFQKNKNFIKKISNIILSIISFGILLYFCAENDNWNKLIISLPKLNLIWIATAVLAILLSWYFDSLIILEIINFFENTYMKKSKIYKITLIGQYFTSITPMGIGSPPAQTSELIKINVKKNNATTIIGAKFIIYQISLAIYSLLCAITYCAFYHLKSRIILVYLTVGLGIQMFTVCLVLAFLVNKNFFIKMGNLSKRIPIILKYKKYFKRLRCSVAFFVGALKNILQDKLLTAKLFLYSFIQISLIFSVPFFIFKAFHHSGSPALEIIETQCVANTVCSFTPLPGNAGASEKIFLDLFRNFFLENELIIAMIIHRIITFYLSIIIGSTVYFFSKRRSKE
ncbi:MAG: lysylphosphatidylglycerol synthase transmembrane domain-containing protein [Clostridia bacterium]|nr:lysylphosphatidylglycerol synthase transmembrane domain-containing protein [Clostridia bacterium]